MNTAFILLTLENGNTEIRRLLSIYKERLDSAIDCLCHGEGPHATDNGWRTWRLLCRYEKETGYLPTKLTDLRDFVLELGHHLKLGANTLDLVSAEIEDVERYREIKRPDFELLCRSTIEEGRVAYAKTTLRRAQTLLGSGGYDPTKREIVTGDGSGILTGVDALPDYLRDRATDEPNATTFLRIEGEWSENTDLIRSGLLDRLDPSKRGRIALGLGPIDSVMNIGPDEDIRYIGLLGFTNGGKSSLLLPMVYNMARSGVNVLFVPLEFSAKATWDRLTFMHKTHFSNLSLCSLQTWTTEPHSVTSQDRATVDFLLDDLKHRRSISGSIDVLEARTWEEIVQHCQANKVRYNYQVLVIDYMANLEVQGRDRIEEMKKLFRKAQVHSQQWDDGRGMLVITPLQANKESRRRAAEREGQDWGSYEGDAGAVEFYTDAVRDMDAVFGVFSEGPLKKANIIKVSCVKSRTQCFDPFLVQLHAKTRYATVSTFNMLEAQAGLPPLTQRSAAMTSLSDPYVHAPSTPNDQRGYF